MIRSPFKTYAAIVTAMIFWAFSFIWFKIANEAFRPVTIVFFRLLISVIILSIYLFLTKGFIEIKKKDRKLFAILALFEPFFYFLGESFGLTYVSATTGSVLISTIPVIATLGAWLIFGERLKIINYAGIIISFIGVLVFILEKDGSLSFNIKGLMLMILAVFSAVGYNLTLSRLVGSYNPVFIVNVQNIIGVLLFMPLFLITDLKHLTGGPFSLRHFLPVVELAFFASCGAFILFAYSVRNMGITRANIFSNCIPVFTAIFSFILLGEKLHLNNIVGMIIVIAGLFMSQINGRKKKTDEALILTGKTA
ncbi:MAG TPA: DMT family transporter [Bacteroidales bacterium]|nr:DMT family transporter [Bacteroidales bacterium]